VVQFRWNTQVTSEEYVSQQLWLEASLPACPVHPKGGCRFGPFGTYERVAPPGTLIPRWYCLEAHTTFSLLPDCFASRLSGTLVDLEQVVATAQAAGTLTLAAHELRGCERWSSALPWLRRRVRLVRQTLVVVITLLPEVFSGCAPNLAAVRAHLHLPPDICVLVRLREIAAPHLGAMPPAVGFGPRTWTAPNVRRRRQQDTGPPRRRRKA
jgi:hypothetical protein